ncbi:hypothetical protein C7441_12225 [Pseudaminobacter salicylatoxidans]|uniref:CopG family transcriptional regulator n=1 Tax=Pseudaminobacter salicylatoxidans TaxID=93369 RepID=A0A316BNE4_PSESE|nr:DUF411 domain-containing protein [Pseudaminobacter salicylatoxidans]PWJ74831.1 hypothetical protein C7441_12225 [Pseudaminobacter salicylatoxidans]
MTSIRKALLAGALLLGSPLVAVAGEANGTVMVYKTPWCGCCELWAQAVEKAGYEVKSMDLEDLSQVRKMAGVPAGMEGCHVAAIDGYFLEGHVPLEAMGKLLSEKPDIAGIAVPGMPEGSLGMGNDPRAVYDVYAVSRDQSVKPSVYYRAGG